MVGTVDLFVAINADTIVDLRDLSSALRKAADSFYHASKCPFTKAAFVDLYNDWCFAASTLGISPDQDGEPTFADILNRD